jgi:hypothetical protein
VWYGETSESESMLTRRKVNNDIKTRSGTISWD